MYTLRSALRIIVLFCACGVMLISVLTAHNMAHIIEKLTQPFMLYCQSKTRNH